MMNTVRTACGWMLLLASVSATAHDAAIAELVLDWPARTLQAELDLQDLDFVLGLDADGDRAIRFDDVAAGAPRIVDYLMQNVRIGNCTLAAGAANVGVRDSVPVRSVLVVDLDCAAVDKVEIESTLFNELPDYKTVLSHADRPGDGLRFVTGDPLEISVGGQEAPSTLAGFGDFLVAGVEHILGGLDHLVFLLLLIMPLTGKATLTQRLVAVGSIVTAFTLAHSLTLSLSALGHISLPSRPVEIAIAGSVILVAILNLLPRFDRFAWIIAYLFGLVHGFGFAGAFAELVSGNSLQWSDMLAFNLGVEAGQLVVVLVALVLLHWLIRGKVVRQTMLSASSAIAIVVAAGWLIERV